MEYDVIIIGAGPAGLSGALVLGRCDRRVLVLDDGKPRNAPSRSMHGFLTREGTPPRDFLQIARNEMKHYPTVEIRRDHVIDVRRDGPGFNVIVRDGHIWSSKKLLLATGLVDDLPEIPGLAERWGVSVFPCPFCDAWEFRGEPTAVLGCNLNGSCNFALEMLTWTRDLTLLTNGEDGEHPPTMEQVLRLGIKVREERIARLHGPSQDLEYIEFEDSSKIRCRALFILTNQHQRTNFAEKLGCPPLTPDRTVRTDDLQHTGQRGVFVAGNASVGLQAAILAAAEGFKAAYAINEELVDDLIASVEHEPAGSVDIMSSTPAEGRTAP